MKILTKITRNHYVYEDEAGRLVGIAPHSHHFSKLLEIRQKEVEKFNRYKEFVKRLTCVSGIMESL